MKPIIYYPDKLASGSLILEQLFVYHGKTLTWCWTNIKSGRFLINFLVHYGAGSSFFENFFSTVELDGKWTTMESRVTPVCGTMEGILIYTVS